MMNKDDKVELIKLDLGKELLGGFETGITGTVVSVGETYPKDYPVIKWDKPVIVNNGDLIEKCDAHISQLRKI